jgi:hypothetical protein
MGGRRAFEAHAQHFVANGLSSTLGLEPWVTLPSLPGLQDGVSAQTRPSGQSSKGDPFFAPVEEKSWFFRGFKPVKPSAKPFIGTMLG